MLSLSSPNARSLLFKRKLHKSCVKISPQQIKGYEGGKIPASVAAILPAAFCKGSSCFLALYAFKYGIAFISADGLK